MTFPGQQQLGNLQKTQKACQHATGDVLDEMSKLMEKALAELRSGNTNAVKELSAQLKSRKVVKRAANATRDFHSSIREFGAMLDESYGLDVSEAARAERLNPWYVNQVIVNHLYREGLFESGDALVEEAGLPDDTANSTKETFAQMHVHLSQIRAGKLSDALEWVRSNRSMLAEEGTPTALEFKLLRLIFLRTLQVDGITAALAFAKGNFAPFQDDFFADIKRLMGCLVYAGRPLKGTPYRDLASERLLQEVASDFVKAACGTLGQASRSPLAVTVAAGSVALPQLLKMIKVHKMSSMSGPQITSLTNEDTMPIEIELGQDFQFHSIFACPVSKEQALQDNPPYMLPCGHVLSLHTIENMAGIRQTFKCPYCPEESERDSCRRLYFPDIT